MTLLVFPTHVREQVLAQHAELRTILGRVTDHAVSRGSDVQERAVRLRRVVMELCERFRAHLVFEADALKPVFAVLDSWGPERIRELETEHARQRRDLRRAPTEGGVRRGCRPVVPGGGCIGGRPPEGHGGRRRGLLARQPPFRRLSHDRATLNKKEKRTMNTSATSHG